MEMLHSSVSSVWSLELLLLLKRHAERVWQRGELVNELRASDTIVDQSLAQMERGGLVVRHADGSANFAPATPELMALVEMLEVEYRSKPATVRRAIVSARDDQLKSFIDAFIIRKPEP